MARIIDPIELQRLWENLCINICVSTMKFAHMHGAAVTRSTLCRVTKTVVIQFHLKMWFIWHRLVMTPK